VALQRSQHRTRMDDEEGRGLTILIHNDRFNAANPLQPAATPLASPRLELPLLEDQHPPPPAPPSTPQPGSAPAAPSFFSPQAGPIREEPSLERSVEGLDDPQELEFMDTA